jgi:hypothetical protein
MKRSIGLGLFVLGLAAGVFGASRHTPVVHAQSSANSMGSNISGCRTVVPKEWGKYQGSSLFGLAFEDEKGTLRFISHPNCGGISESQETVAASIADLSIIRN